MCCNSVFSKTNEQREKVTEREGGVGRREGEGERETERERERHVFGIFSTYS